MFIGACAWSLLVEVTGRGESKAACGQRLEMRPIEHGSHCLGFVIQPSLLPPPPQREKSLNWQVRNLVGLGMSTWEPQRLEEEKIFREHEVREDFPE